MSLGPSAARSSFFMMTLLLTSCYDSGTLGVDEMHWKQEVLLHDGRMIVIDGSAARRSSGFPNSKRGPVLRQELRYAPRGLILQAPGTKQIPLAFDVFEGQAYLVTILGGRDLFCRNKAPGTFVANFYRFVGKQFVRVDQKDVPIDMMLDNLTAESYWGATAETDPTFISWREHARGKSFNPDKPRTVAETLAKNEYLHCPNLRSIPP